MTAPVEPDGRLQLHDGGDVSRGLSMGKPLHRRVQVVDVRLTSQQCTEAGQQVTFTIRTDST